MLEKLYLDLKTIRWFLLIPILSVCVVVPGLNLYDISRYGAESAASSVFFQLQIFAAVSGALPVVFLLRPLVDGDGSEVLYTFSRIRRTGWVSPAACCAIHLALVGGLFVWYTRYFSNLWPELFRTAAQVVFFCGLAYCCTYLFRSTLAGFLGTVVVWIVMLVNVQPSMHLQMFLQKACVFSVITSMNPRPVEWAKYTAVLVLGTLLFLVGALRNRRLFD